MTICWASCKKDRRNERKPAGSHRAHVTHSHTLNAMKAFTLLLSFALITVTALPACRKKTVGEKVGDKIDDALDQRPGEKIRDAVEDAKK